MPFIVVRQDITKMKVDAIVNAANINLTMGGGVCGAIFRAAGADKLRAACDKLRPISTGEAVITPAFSLNAKYIIHAAGPIYSDKIKDRCAELLRSAYTEALKIAAANKCESIAFPLISSGIYGYPKAEAIKIAWEAITNFIAENDMAVYLAVLDKETLVLCEQIIGD